MFFSISHREFIFTVRSDVDIPQHQEAVYSMKDGRVANGAHSILLSLSLSLENPFPPGSSAGSWGRY